MCSPGEGETVGAGNRGTPDSLHEQPTVPPSTLGAEAARAVHDEPTVAPSTLGAEAPTMPPGDAQTSMQPASSETPTEPARPASNPALRVRYFGDYELIQEIARGGMGVVYRARQVSLNRPVALKMILAGQLATEQDVARFRLEAEAAANLDHAGIVPIYEIGEHHGQHYFSMGFVEGTSLAARVADGPLPPREAAELVRQVCEAVQYAHERGVIHRDLKPANVLLDAQGRPKVTDFGLAKKLQSDSGLTQTGQVMGTPSYMPPEQAAGNNVGPAADVYALGAVLYCLLTGRPPFQAANSMDTLLQVINQEPVAVRQLNATVPRDLETITLKALQKEPIKRYASAAALGDDLQRFLKGEAITARPVGRLEKAAKWARRHKAVAGLSAVVSLLLVGGTAAIITLQAQSNAALAGKNAELTASNQALEEQRKRAEQREQQAIDAVKRFGDVVKDEPLLKNSLELEELRKKLLQEPLGFFSGLREQLLADNDTRAETLERLAEVIHSHAHLTDEIGNPQDGLETHNDSLAIWERLARSDPSNLEYQRGLAGIESCRGNFLSKLGRHEEARAAQMAALEIRERLAREHPTVKQLQNGLAGSHYNIGNLQADMGRPEDALISYKCAIEILNQLVREDPSVTEFQRDLANCYTSMGALLHAKGRFSDTLAAYTRALDIFEYLVRENPHQTRLQSELASGHYNVGILLMEMGRPDEALTSYNRAVEIRERLTRENPTVTQFQSDLARSYGNISLLYNATGRTGDALASYSKTIDIFERLARENPTISDYQRDLAISLNNIGMLQSSVGRLKDALASYTRALEIRRRMAIQHPESPKHASSVGGTLNNMALVDLDEKLFEQARVRLEEAIIWQKKALATNPDHPTYRQFLGNHYSNLMKVARGLGDAALAAKAQRGLAELDRSDPAKLALTARLESVLKGKPPQDNRERLSLAQHAYDTSRFVAATQLWAESIQADPEETECRTHQPAYNAACAAALAADGKGDDAPAADDPERAALRNKALGWLQTELGIWTKLLESGTPEERQKVGPTLAHWQADPDLAPLRGISIDSLPEPERPPWHALWN